MSAILRAFTNLVSGQVQDTKGPALKETTTELELLETSTNRVLTETL